jgi:hypothetical protein
MFGRSFQVLQDQLGQAVPILRLLESRQLQMAEVVAISICPDDETCGVDGSISVRPH